MDIRKILGYQTEEARLPQHILAASHELGKGLTAMSAAMKQLNDPALFAKWRNARVAFETVLGDLEDEILKQTT